MAHQARTNRTAYAHWSRPLEAGCLVVTVRKHTASKRSSENVERADGPCTLGQREIGTCRETSTTAKCSRRGYLLEVFAIFGRKLHDVICKKSIDWLKWRYCGIVGETTLAIQRATCLPPSYGGWTPQEFGVASRCSVEDGRGTACAD